MESKKRKREAELPRVTYDAATRTFDRLFKEDSLEDMKTVVRKKLSLSPSFPVYLSQLRDGKSVDLEDDDDFEAFSASAHASSTVKVKVVLGEYQQTPPIAVETEVASVSARRKRKKKSKQNTSTLSTSLDSPVEVPESQDNAHRAKRQKVSFEEDSLDDVQTLSKEKSKKEKQKTPSDDSMVTKVSNTDTEPEPEQPDEADPAKAKKKSKKSKQTNEDGDSGGNPLNGGPPGADSVDGTTMGGDSYDPTPKPKKSKKRQRPDSPPTEAVEDATMATDMSGQKANLDESERVSKKSKKKVTNNADSDVAVPPALELPTLLADPSLRVAPIEEPTKKSRKKKTKSPPVTEVQAASDIASEKSEKVAPKASTKASSKELTAEHTTIAEPPAHAESGTAPAAKKSAAIEIPAKETAAKKSKKSKQKEVEKDSEISEANLEKPKDSASGSKETLPQVKTTLVSATGAKEKSKKGKDRAIEIGIPVEDVVAEDIQNASVATSAKTPKKGSKQKKDHTQTVEQPSTTQAKPPVQNANRSQAIDMKEVTRLIVEKIMKKAANKNPSSFPAVVQPTIQPAMPGSSGLEEIVEATTAISSPPKSNAVPAQPLAVKSSAPKETVVAGSGSSIKEPSPPPACPICNNSPLHPRSKCPIIKSGIKAMRKKVAELEKETSEEDAESRSSVILELQGIIERRTRKPRVSEVAKPAPPPLPVSNTDSPEVEVEPLSPTVNSPKSQSVTEPNARRKSFVQPESQVSASVQVSSSNKGKTTVPVIDPSPPPSTRQNARQLSLSQPTSQLPVSVQIASSSKVTNASQGVKQPLPPPTEIAENLLSSQLNGFGDVSSFTDKDLDTIIRGPRLSIKNVVPDSDSSTEEEESEHEEVVLEEDEVESKKMSRNLARSGYPSSSDEGDEEEEEEEEGSGPSTPHNHPATAAIVEDSEVPSDIEENIDVGNLSFGELNAVGSSVEPDRMGDSAAQAAVSADLAPLNFGKPAQENDLEDDPKQTSDSPESYVPTPADSPPPTTTTAKDDNADPIEPSDVPPASQPEPIASDDEAPLVESTPKSEIVIRTRSQRNAAVTKLDPKGSQKPVSQSKANGVEVEEVPKPARRTRNLVRISELPVPPNPSVRMIRQAAAPAATPRTRRQIALEQEKEKEGTPEPDLAMRSRRATTAAKAKTPAKPLSKVTKTTARPLSKQKAAAIIVEDNEKTMENSSSVEADLSQTKATSSPEKGGAVSSWATLPQETVPSQADTETPGMVDELLSSPNIMPTTSPLGQSGNRHKSVSVNGFQPDPLFIPAESQQSFPYSQYPDIPPKNPDPVSPNDSDDEEEVRAFVGKSITASINSTYRSLRELASQPSRLFQPRPSQISHTVQETRVEDLYGRSGRQSEDSDSSSDSDADDKPVKAASHIPASRRAGASQTKEKINL